MRISMTLLMIMVVHLTGCNQQNLKSDEHSPDLSDIARLEQKANEAYLNEDWETAEKSYQDLADLKPNVANTWFRLGNIYARVNKSDAAIAAYQKALIHEPENAKVWHNLGVIQLKQAAKTFLEMRQHTVENDPLAIRARHAINSIANLIDTGFIPE